MTIQPHATRRLSRLRSWSIWPWVPACHTPSYSMAIFRSGQARSTRATKPFAPNTEYWTSGADRPRMANRTRSRLSCGDAARESANPSARPNRRHPRSPFRSRAYVSSSDRRTRPAPSIRSISTTASPISSHWARSQQVRTGSVTASAPSMRTSSASRSLVWIRKPCTGPNRCAKRNDYLDRIGGFGESDTVHGGCGAPRDARALRENECRRRVTSQTMCVREQFVGVHAPKQPAPGRATQAPMGEEALADRLVGSEHLAGEGWGTVRATGHIGSLVQRGVDDQ